MLRAPMLTLLLGLALVACDSNEVTPPDTFPFDPDTTDFDAIARLDYGDYVQPLLAFRDAFSRTASDSRGTLADYEWDDVFYGEPGTNDAMSPGETIVPFDAEGSFLVRFVEDLPDDAAVPFPNLRNLQDDEVRYLKRWIEDGARDDDGMVPYHDSVHLLYAAVQGANYVAVIDAERRQVIRNIYFNDLGVTSVPNGPHYMVFEPDRSAVYVSIINANKVVKISGSLEMDPSDPAYLLAVSSDFTTPGMMALDPDTDRLYVGRSTASQPGTTPTVGVFNTADLSEIDQYAIPDPGTSFPHAIGLTPDGKYLLTAPLVGDYALSMDAMTGDYISRIPVGGTAELVHFSILPDGSTATLTANPANDSPDEVLFFSVGTDGALTLTGDVPTGGERAWHAHLDSDGVTVLVPNNASNSVSLIDVPSKTLRLEVEDDGGAGTAGNWPLAMPYAPGPTHAGAFFVSNSNLGTNGLPVWTPLYPFQNDSGETPGNEQFGNVTALDPATGAVLKVIQLGRYPTGLEHWHEGGHMHGMQHGGHQH